MINLQKLIDEKKRDLDILRVKQEQLVIFIADLEKILEDANQR